VLEPTPRARLLATTDLLIEGVHFRRAWATPFDIGWKAMAVNLSDIAAKGGRPRWALVGLALPAPANPADVAALCDGMREAATPHGVIVVGGDTSVSPGGWFVTLTLLGEHDGLSADLGHGCRESGVGARVAVDRVPVDGGAREIARALGAEPLAWAIGGGEDYELLLTCDAAEAEALADGLRRATGATLTVIGEIEGLKAGVVFVDAAGHRVAMPAGYEHFRA